MVCDLAAEAPPRRLSPCQPCLSPLPLSQPVDDAGFIVTVLPRVGGRPVVEDADIAKGRVDPMTGFVRYVVAYNALMFRPFKNEVLDAVVKSVSEVGFFAEAGPLSVLVSHAHIPDDMEFVPADGSYTSAETGVKIRADMPVRLKVIGATVLQSALWAIGSIKDDYLGLLA